MGGIKEQIQSVLHRRCLRLYERELDRQKNSYPHKRKSSIALTAGKAAGRCRIVPISQVCADVMDVEEEYLLFAKDGGWLEEKAFRLAEEEFAKDPSCLWFYGDEDLCTGDGICCFPDLKPDWSPDTFLSYFYIGGFIAVRKGAAGSVCAAMPEEYRQQKGLPFLYMLCLLLASAEPPVHIREVLYHGPLRGEVRRDNNMLLCEPECGGAEWTALKESYLSRRRIEGHFSVEGDGIAYPLYALPQAKISILILSKDHPELLQNCVRSIKEKSTFPDYEIIVCDNGSEPANYGKYERLAAEYDFAYLYRPQEFNFSKLCNTIAREAQGSYLLFLNDDTEVITPDWLERMLGEAARPGAGAVGAKLYYPEGDLIQHCGVTNMYEGPVHKLAQYSDAVSYDRGRNRGVRNVLAVTAACVLLSKERFWEMGGFCEEIAVAYNDVDLCMRLHHAGYRNVIRNDVKLYHYESVSRGDDNKDKAKRERLKRERTKLFLRNPDYAGRDPYDHPCLTQGSVLYEAAYPHEDRYLPPAESLEQMPEGWQPGAENEALIVNAERMEEDAAAKRMGKDLYIIDLYAHVRGLDNCDYRFAAYLRSQKACYRLPIVRRYRPDVERIHYEQKHVELAGLAVRIEKKALPSGRYELWIEADSLLSRQKLFRRADMELNTETE